MDDVEIRAVHLYMRLLSVVVVVVVDGREVEVEIKPFGEKTI